jgi:hypothetical protein
LQPSLAGSLSSPRPDSGSEFVPESNDAVRIMQSCTVMVEINKTGGKSK